MLLYKIHFVSYSATGTVPLTAIFVEISTQPNRKATLTLKTQEHTYVGGCHFCPKNTPGFL